MFEWLIWKENIGLIFFGKSRSPYYFENKFRLKKAVVPVQKWGSVEYIESRRNKRGLRPCWH